MTCLEKYQAIITHKEFDQKIGLFLEKIESYGLLKVIDYRKAEWQGFPYLLITEEYNDKMPVDYMARYLSVSLDFSSMCAEAPDYYFPFVCVLESHPRMPDSILSENRDAVIIHEVCHVRDLLEYVEANPGYYEDMKQYGFSYINETTDLEKSIRFEIDKRLAIEPPALNAEYEMGCTTIPIPVLFFIKKYQCESAEEFIKLNLYGELHDLLELYKKKFADQNEKIQLIFKNVITTGKHKYAGERGYEEIMDIYNNIYGKLGFGSIFTEE